MGKQIVFLNGPPRSGKDTIAEYMVSTNPRGIKHLKFADILKKTAHNLVGLNVAPDALEDSKDTPSSMLPRNMVTGDYYTPRELYIYVSEVLIKPNMGGNYFGVALAKTITSNNTESIFVISDSGFVDEATTITNKFGAENCLLVHLYRESCDFKGDSRSHWQPPTNLRTISIHNVSHDYSGLLAISKNIQLELDNL